MTTYIGTSGNDSVSQPFDNYYGLDGDDRIFTVGAGLHLVEGGAGNDLLVFQSGNFGSIYGGEGDDLALGNAQSDFIFGGLGSDLLVGGNFNIFTGADPNLSLAPSGDDTIEGGQA